jgi:hypothetical protein
VCFAPPLHEGVKGFCGVRQRAMSQAFCIPAHLPCFVTECSHLATRNTCLATRWSYALFSHLPRSPPVAVNHTINTQTSTIIFLLKYLLYGAYCLKSPVCLSPACFARRREWASFKLRPPPPSRCFESPCVGASWASAAVSPALLLLTSAPATPRSGSSTSTSAAAASLVDRPMLLASNVTIHWGYPVSRNQQTRISIKHARKRIIYGITVGSDPTITTCTSSEGQLPRRGFDTARI